MQSLFGGGEKDILTLLMMRKLNPKLLFNPIWMSVLVYEWQKKRCDKHIVSIVSEIVENSFTLRLKLLSCC